MKLLTWNIDSKPEKKQAPSFNTLDCAIVLLDHYARSDYVIGCIQEAPTADTDLKRYVENKTTRLSCTLSDAKAQLIYSRDLLLKESKPDNTKRAIITLFETPSKSLLHVIGLHFHDRANLEHPEARGGACALFRANIDDLIDVTRPLVVLGDFNAQPDSFEITSPYCLYGRTQFDKVVDRHKTVTGKLRQPLFVKKPDGDGTYYYSRDEGWKTLDYMLISADLQKQFISIKCCTNILGKELLTSSEKQIPRSDISDHLPVLAELHFQ